VTVPRRWPAALVLALGFIRVGTVAAAEQVHTVVAGESAAVLAKKYYGERDLGDQLLRYNGRLDKVIHPGERLTIPFCEIYRARTGDTWSALAKRHLGRTSAAPVLAELNGCAAGEPLRAGARVVIPVVLRHSLARGETLSSLAERFYGDPHKAAVLQEFSRIDDANRLAVGTALEIPLVNFLRREAEPAKTDVKEPDAVAAPIPIENAAVATPSASPVEAAKPSPPEARRFETPLAAAGLRFADGEYDRARELLEALRERVTSEGAAADRREWGELLAFVYIALDRDADACTAYRTGVPHEAPTDFDPDLVSPRIRAVLSNCAAASSNPERLDIPGAPPQVPLHAGTRG
jgi:phage tail protein X